ncbi:hypothetical protein M436DRAFT_66959 [Aureobasidium namibiae CBS 147.97]|uniref:Uncharacterized protein n=1 Tax=Aureobasidium namibiae CBS 147.97 TaxID=1043004 RepID=A0A074WDR4_9PEZI|nr:uncharacterized protein M436DRAFT_66959 [Aureobasidium namibiae CBS 147.97]KEQ69694.1 hypothetical protein M436DRAFT_66959 [Aureobasidium namibiae CBS 147.97]
MDDSMILDPMATHQVSVMPPRDPTPTEIYLDEDPKNLAHDISNTAASPTLDTAGMDSIPMQLSIHTHTTALETNAQIPFGAVAEAETASVEVQMDIGTDKTVTAAEANPEVVEEVAPASLSQAEGPDDNYTTPASVEDATTRSDVTVHEAAKKDTSVKAINDAPHAEEVITIEAHNPVIIRREVSEAIDTESTTDDTAAPDLKLTKAVASEQKDSSTVNLLVGERTNSCPESSKPSTLAVENTQEQYRLALDKIASEVVSPDNDPSRATESNSEAGNSDDTCAEIRRLTAAYDSSGEDQTKPKGSLFGGPAGPQIPLHTDTPKISEGRTFVQTETLKGFEELFPEEVTSGNNVFPEDSGLDINSFHFTNSNTEQDAELGAEAGAEQEDVLEQPTSSDQDPKPDVEPSHDPTSPNYTWIPTSPAYSHTTSNNSHATHKSYESEVQSILGLNLDDPYNVAADIQETPEAYASLERNPGHIVPELPGEQPPCNCEQPHCGHRVIIAFNLRKEPRKEHCVYINNLVYDNDPSGTYTDEQKYYPSAQKVAIEDLDEDEESNNDGEEDRVMSGGLPTGPTDPNGRFKTIPFNHTDTLIRDKMSFGEESSSSDESRTKKNKKRKKTKTKSSKASKKSKNNNGTAIIRATQSDEEDVRIDEQASTPVLKASTRKPATKKPSSTTTPDQTIVQMLQRLAKPHTTRLCYPITFNCPAASSSICKSSSYATKGCSPTPRKIKIYDFGQGSQEIPDENEAGSAVVSAKAKKPEQTQLCLSCTTRYMKILMCSTHDISPIIASPSQPASTSSPPSDSSSPTEARSPQISCTICAAPSTYTCETSCGANFCDTCSGKVYGEHEGNLSALLDTMTDEVTAEYPQGLRADVEVLRKGGELWKFLSRMARKKA